MSAPVQLIGLDFGTTTSSAIIATARLCSNSVTGRMELDEFREQFRSERAFTPYCGDLIDEARLEAYLDAWLEPGLASPPVFGGGALLTGLTAKAANAPALVRLIRRRLGQALVARADDPCLEAWLAFMGSCAALSREHPQASVLNLDIGGGTTNLALGRGGEVVRTGCLFVGARHFAVEPGTYKLVRLSPHARSLLAHLQIARGPGDVLRGDELESILDFYVGLLEETVRGAELTGPLVELHTQVPLRMPAGIGALIVTLSGGVGELVYGAVKGQTWPATTAFGDLGIDLARGLLRSPVLGPHLRRFAPTAGGRATVYGLLRHSTEVSGSTLYLSDPSLLPLADVPLLGSISETSSDEEIAAPLRLLRERPVGVHVALERPGAQAARMLGSRLAGLLRTAGPTQPLVLLMRDNLGKTLGNYVTAWGAAPNPLVVLDEIALRDAQFVHIGVPHGQVVPVSYYGLNP